MDGQDLQGNKGFSNLIYAIIRQKYAYHTLLYVKEILIQLNIYEYVKKCDHALTKKSVSDGVVMLPDKEVIDGDVGNLGLSSIWSQESKPVLGGNDIVWMCGGLRQFKNVKELLELFRGQGVDVPPDHRCFPLVTVWSGPAKFTLTTVVPCKVTCSTESKLNMSNHVDVVDDVPGSTLTKTVSEKNYMTHQYICKSD